MHAFRDESRIVPGEDLPKVTLTLWINKVFRDFLSISILSGYRGRAVEILPVACKRQSVPYLCAGSEVHESEGRILPFPVPMEALRSGLKKLPDGSTTE